MSLAIRGIYGGVPTEWFQQGQTLDDYGVNAVRYSLLSAAVTTTLGALLFIWGARTIREDIKRAT